MEEEEANSEQHQNPQQSSLEAGQRVARNHAAAAVPVSVEIRSIPGGELPLVLPQKAAWFDAAEIHEIEKVALPEYFDSVHEAQGKTRESYLWHRQAIISQWHLHMAAHISQQFAPREKHKRGAHAAGTKRRAPASGAAKKRRRGASQVGESQVRGLPATRASSGSGLLVAR